MRNFITHTEVISDAKKKYPGYNLETTLAWYYQFKMILFSITKRKEEKEKADVAGLICSAIRYSATFVN